jgi:hypothetical protein
MRKRLEAIGSSCVLIFYHSSPFTSRC